MESYVGRPDCSVPFVSGDGEVDDVPSQHGEVAHLVVVGVGEICDTGEGVGEGGGRRRGQLITPCRFFIHIPIPLRLVDEFSRLRL